MKIRVKLFAVAKELTGCDELTLDLPSGATVANLRDAVLEKAPTLHRIVPHSLWAVGAEYATADTPLSGQSEVALIPPVSGG